MTMTRNRPAAGATPVPAQGVPPQQPAAPRRPARPAPPGDDAWSVIATTSLMLCLVAGWMLAQMLYLGGISQDRTQDDLYAQFRGELAAATAPIGPVTEVGAPVALLQIPHIGLEQVVVEGTASGDLLAGPGHLRNTVLPGQLGDLGLSDAHAPTELPSRASASSSRETRSTSPPRRAPSGSASSVYAVRVTRCRNRDLRRRPGSCW